MIFLKESAEANIRRAVVTLPMNLVWVLVSVRDAGEADRVDEASGSEGTMQERCRQDASSRPACQNRATARRMLSVQCVLSTAYCTTNKRGKRESEWLLHWWRSRSLEGVSHPDVYLLSASFFYPWHLVSPSSFFCIQPTRRPDGQSSISQSGFAQQHPSQNVLKMFYRHG